MSHGSAQFSREGAGKGRVGGGRLWGRGGAPKSRLACRLTRVSMPAAHRTRGGKLQTWDGGGRGRQGRPPSPEVLSCTFPTRLFPFHRQSHQGYGKARSSPGQVSGRYRSQPLATGVALQDERRSPAGPVPRHPGTLAITFPGGDRCAARGALAQTPGKVPLAPARCLRSRFAAQRPVAFCPAQPLKPDTRGGARVADGQGGGRAPGRLVGAPLTCSSAASLHLQAPAPRAQRPAPSRPLPQAAPVPASSPGASPYQPWGLSLVSLFPSLALCPGATVLRASRATPRLPTHFAKRTHHL